MNFKTWRLSKLGLLAMLISFGLMSCESDSISGDKAQPTAKVALQFKMQTATAMTTFAKTTAASADTLEIKGTNGTLYLSDISFIVDEFELENELENDAEVDSLEDYNEFEGEMYFVNLKLDGTPLKLADSPIPAGTYNSLEFEIDNLEADSEDDMDDRQAIKDLMAKIKQDYPAWPTQASMVVTGKFVSNDGTETPFTTYAKAEVSIENNLVPPMQVGKDSSKMLSININPEKWFTNADGTAKNLADYDYETTQKLLDLEVEIENGFVDVEIEED